MIPLQIFEKHPTADAYRVGGFYSPYALVSRDKRFSDAELAAEYWRSRYVHEAVIGQSGFHVDGRGNVIIESRVLMRFWSRPHAHETDYQ